MSNHGTENGVSAVLNDQIHLSDPPHQPDIKIEYLRKFSELISTESYGISKFDNDCLGSNASYSPEFTYDDYYSQISPID